MDRQTWMYKISHVDENYIKGVNEFISCALKHQDMKEKELGYKDLISCPCHICGNLKFFSDINIVEDHLFRNGFKRNYTKWIWHGEVVNSRGTSHKNYEDDGDSMTNNEEDDLVNDRVEEMIQDVEDQFIHQPDILENLVRDSKKLLYPGCNNEYTRLSTTLKLCKMKVKNGWTDRSFTELLKLLRDILPPNNDLPTSTYEAKKILCPMGMDVKKIHACPNDCVLFRNEHEDLLACLKCGASRYKPDGNNSSEKNKKRPPVKVFWYLPIVDRFKCLFANTKDAKHLRWHAEGRKSDGMLRHPSDSPQWRTIDGKFPEFGYDARNLRLELCADGMNPYRTLSCNHNTWPVLLSIYNLPPWLCMKRKYIMLALLISGPKEPGNNIDVYLQPLIEDLNLLWDKGVTVFDSYSQSNLNLRAMIFCTISDFPGYGNLSGYPIKGDKACPICEEDTNTHRLNNCKKNVYMNHRRFLPLDHPYHKRKRSFDGHVETREARLPLTGLQTFEKVKDLNVVFGKFYKRPQENIWKKKSIFWELPYWKHLQVRHSLDIMHIEKNVCESIIGTLLNIAGKTKDGIKARLDMKEMGIRKELAPQESTKHSYLPPACFTLSRKEKISFCKYLSSVKAPHGYSSNIKKLFSMKDLKLVGLKSHDYHVLMQQLLPVAIRGILPKHVRFVSTRLCFFFNAICSKVIDPDSLDKLQADIIVTLCQFEMYFSFSFFDIMCVCDLTYPFERFLCTLKGYVKNRYRPEGSIVEAYSIEEAIEFCTEYLASEDPIGIPRSRNEGRLEGYGTLGVKMISPGAELLDRAHIFILQHMTEVNVYLEEHITKIRQKNRSKNHMWVTKEHIRSFSGWFKERVMCTLPQMPGLKSNTVKWLAYGPSVLVRSYESYDVNGYTFYTQHQDDKSAMQNRGVCVEASSTEITRGSNNQARDVKKSYYGFIEEIWELDYTDFKVALFKCKWFDIRRGVREDELGFTLVDLSRFGHEDDPFILATQVKQVFYIQDHVDSKYSIVIQGNRHILGIDDVVDEDEYNQFDENPPFSTGLPTSYEDESFDTSYARNDHDEGMWID
ncbi:uncharacterized protein LOC141679687 [Apium graveolens]|uniref:uncharacterized protein LOC141679687 n=1 Tax=Apium graveolens TaxID=4045 RepID=UPI003D7AF824